MLQQQAAQVRSCAVAQLNSCQQSKQCSKPTATNVAQAPHHPLPCWNVAQAAHTVSLCAASGVFDLSSYGVVLREHAACPACVIVHKQLTAHLATGLPSAASRSSTKLHKADHWFPCHTYLTQTKTSNFALRELDRDSQNPEDCDAVP
jgi:hypothetical protein